MDRAWWWFWCQFSATANAASIQPCLRRLVVSRHPVVDHNSIVLRDGRTVKPGIHAYLVDAQLTTEPGRVSNRPMILLAPLRVEANLGGSSSVRLQPTCSRCPSASAVVRPRLVRRSLQPIRSVSDNRSSFPSGYGYWPTWRKGQRPVVPQGVQEASGSRPGLAASCSSGEMSSARFAGEEYARLRHDHQPGRRARPGRLAARRDPSPLRPRGTR